MLGRGGANARRVHICRKAEPESEPTHTGVDDAFMLARSRVVPASLFRAALDKLLVLFCRNLWTASGWPRTAETEHDGPTDVMRSPGTCGVLHRYAGRLYAGYGLQTSRTVTGRICHNCCDDSEAMRCWNGQFRRPRTWSPHHVRSTVAGGAPSREGPSGKSSLGRV